MSARDLSAAELVDELAKSVDSVVGSLFKNARPTRRHWFVGDVDDNPGNSLYIHRQGARAGRWCDCATGQKGDVLGLIKARMMLDTAGACRWAEQFLRRPRPPNAANADTMQRWPAQSCAADERDR